MKIPGKEIFTDNSVVLVGYSKDASHFSHMVYHSLLDAEIKVYPYNPNKAEYSVKVYNSFSEIENIPEVAIILLNKEDLTNGIDDILSSGIKRIIINNKNHVTDEILNKCAEKSIFVNILCPLLIVGNGFHKVHKFFAKIF